MILGIGTDVIQIPRIERLINTFGGRFISRILSPEEIEIYNRKTCKAFVARRFAGKEAIFKALGVGVGKPLRFTEISIINNALGKPEVRLKKAQNNMLVHISLSDDYPIATAFAIITEK